MVIYKVVVLSVVAALVSLPLITISVSVQSAGIIRPTVEKTPLVAPVSGRISRILAVENDLVAERQEVLALDDEVVEEKLRALTGDIRVKSDLARDLETLISSGTQAKDPIHLLTESATAERAHFLNLLRENRYARRNAAEELDRTKRLFSAAAAPETAVEERAFALQTIEVQGDILARRKSAEWNQQLLDVKLRLSELTATLHELENERDLTRIRAPVSGSLEQFSGLTPGSYVQAGQTVAWVSPDAELVAEIYVSPATSALCDRASRFVCKWMPSTTINGVSLTRQCSTSRRTSLSMTGARSSRSAARSFVAVSRSRTGSSVT